MFGGIKFFRLSIKTVAAQRDQETYKESSCHHFLRIANNQKVPLPTAFVKELLIYETLYYVWVASIKRQSSFIFLVKSFPANFPSIHITRSIQYYFLLALTLYTAAVLWIYFMIFFIKLEFRKFLCIVRIIIYVFFSQSLHLLGITFSADMQWKYYL